METYCSTQPSNGSVEYGKNVNVSHNRRNEAPKSHDMGCVQRPSKAIAFMHNNIVINTMVITTVVIKVSRVGISVFRNGRRP